MITQNTYLRPHGIFTFSIPALAGRFDDGTPYVTCPAAGVCAAVCYARTGTFRFPEVLAKHQRNLLRIKNDLPQWKDDMLAELAAPRLRGGKYLRVHDAGDFFSVLWGSSACGVTLHQSPVWRPMRRFSGGVALWLFVADQRGAETHDAGVCGEDAVR